MMYSRPLAGSVSMAGPSVRADFLTRVYGTFLCSIVLTCIVGWFAYQPTVAPAILGSIMILAIVGLVVGIGMQFASRVSGLNIALLAVYSAIQGAILGAFMAFLNSNPVYRGVPQEAVGITVAVFLGLTAYVRTSGKDFSFMGGFLWIATIGLVVAGLILMFFPGMALLNTVYTLGGVLIFGGYVLYDTSNIMNRLGPDDAITGAIQLYIDFVGLLWFIMRLLTDRRN